MPYKRTILLGVVGDSAAGKTTLSAGIARILGEERVTVICSDDYHRYNRAQRKENGLSALDPACNYIDIMEQHFDSLRRGHAILKPIYNHSTGDFDPPEYIQPKEFVIIEGLLGYHSKSMRNNFDVKVYLEPEEELRIQWKIQRDTTKRGYTPEQVRESLAKRVHDSRNFIQVQKQYADMVVNFYRPPGYETETGSHLNVRLSLRPTLPYPDLSDVLETDAKDGRRMLTSTISRESGRLTETLDINGQITPQQTATLEDIIWSHLPELQHLRPEEMGHFVNGNRVNQSSPLALSQLLITYNMLVAMQELQKDRREREKESRRSR
ncbi:MAG: phosphoribulokinase [Chloroflexi bacterium]|nr:MAG: phosphoribulokinase [Chloroflexota bacterium]